VTVDIGTFPPGPMPESDAGARRRRQRKGFLLLLLLLLLAMLTSVVIWYLIFRQPLPLPPIPESAVPSYATSIYGTSGPMGVAVSTSGDRIYVADTEGDRVVRIFSAGGAQVGVLPPPESALVTGFVPVYLALHPTTGEVWVTDRPTGSLHVYDRDGAYLRQFRPTEAEGGWQPVGVTFDPAGNLYVTDLSRSQRVLKYDPQGVLLLTLGADQGLAFPNGVAVDADGRIYVTDSNNGRLLVFAPDGELLGRVARGAGAGNLGLPRGIAIDNQGRVFVVDSSGQGVVVYGVLDANDQQPKRLGAFMKHGLGDGEFAFPTGVAVDDRGRVYVADTANNRIQVWSY
jgi:DNA-binding beta-propeller fold protein YncE